MGWLVAVMWNHGPGMWRVMRNQKKSLPDLNPQEMADVLAFMYQASNEGRPGDPKVGIQLFTHKGCIQCHSIGRTGGKVAFDLCAIAAVSNSTDWMSAMLNHAGSMIEPVTNTLGEWPQFKDREMSDLIALSDNVLLGPPTFQPQGQVMRNGAGPFFKDAVFSVIPFEDREAKLVRNWDRNTISPSLVLSSPVSCGITRRRC